MKETIRAAFVIARRDFTAIIFSKSFIIFLAGPLFPLIIAIAASGLGKQVNEDIDRPIIGVALDAADSAAILAAREKLVTNLGENGVPELIRLDGVDPNDPDIADQLDKAARPLTAILSGSLETPRLTGSARDIQRWQGRMALLSETALSRSEPVQVQAQAVASTGSATKRNRLVVAQGGQVILILLTMILAGMVLSNLVEEKTNKIIEILAAAIPMDAIFLGKLFAMLGMAIVGITVWATLGFVGLTLATSGLPNLPVPAVGWPIFCVLMILYFSMAYLLLGSLFLGIGAMAATVREVQTLSMPVTMGQLLVFFLAAFSVTKLGEPVEWAAVLIPFSSPFAMIARAAQMDNLWQHGVALVWQAMFTLIIIRFSVILFRRNVMKSGNSVVKKGLLATLLAFKR
ncbi:ABC-2 type transport system permease protein [Parasphingorhabdus marina DSM 22363]|uniref:ABC-2 type transport system permease protein n=1 Tax=Parasphingorhabdus marina DSM 22363 TaxID=1123272 RepID=A0A1N6CZE5_9SPHN|nr:ABC transporter permease [Parasphingorhabdus marina]SIN63885.1 ABC-2 type transport system permease protein [Parasphingorhabdus marina DSM 22363]